MFDFDLIIIAVVLTICIAGGKLIMALAMRSSRKYPSCAKCGYNLIGIVGGRRYCPECGKLIAGGKFQKWGQLPRALKFLHGAGLFISLIGIIGLAFLAVVIASILVANW